MCLSSHLSASLLTFTQGTPVQRSRSLSPASSVVLGSGSSKGAEQRIQDLEELLRLKVNSFFYVLNKCTPFQVKETFFKKMVLPYFENISTQYIILQYLMRNNSLYVTLFR